MAQSGGEGLSPFHRLIEGGKKGWLINEMEELFYYAQIFRQGGYTIAAKITSDTVGIKQIPNLMRAIGYFPTNKEVFFADNLYYTISKLRALILISVSNVEIEFLVKQILFKIKNIMMEVCCKHYFETGTLIEEITFEEFVRLYVNHRPAFELSMRQIKKAFRTFVEENFNSRETPMLTREQFMNVLFGSTLTEDNKTIGENSIINLLIIDFVENMSSFKSLLYFDAKCIHQSCQI